MGEGALAPVVVVVVPDGVGEMDWGVRNTVSSSTAGVTAGVGVGYSREREIADWLFATSVRHVSLAINVPSTPTTAAIHPLPMKYHVANAQQPRT